MSESGLARVRAMQARIEEDAKSVTTYWDLRRLQAYWSDLELIALDEEADNR